MGFMNHELASAYTISTFEKGEGEVNEHDVLMKSFAKQPPMITNQ